MGKKEKEKKTTKDCYFCLQNTLNWSFPSACDNLSDTQIVSFLKQWLYPLLLVYIMV